MNKSAILVDTRTGDWCLHCRYDTVQSTTYVCTVGVAVKLRGKLVLVGHDNLQMNLCESLAGLGRERFESDVIYLASFSTDERVLIHLRQKIIISITIINAS